MELELMKIGTDLVPAELQERVKSEVGGMLLGTSTIEKINTPEEAENAVELCKEIKVLSAKLDSDRKGLVAPLNGKVAAINDFYRVPVEALGGIEKNIKKVATVYAQEQERIRLEEQRKADEKARLERMKAEEEARKKREDEEKARRDAEEKRQQAENEEDEKKRAALLAEAAKDDQKAEKAAGQAESHEIAASSTVPQVMTGPVPKPKGFSVSYDYKAEVEDPIAFMDWCFANEKYHLLEINSKTLNKMVSAEKEAFKAPGIRVCKVSSAAVSTRIRKAA